METSRLGGTAFVFGVFVVGLLAGLAGGIWGARYATRELAEELQQSQTLMQRRQETDDVAARPSEPAIVARGTLAEAERTSVEIFRNNSPSVVFITTLTVRRDFFRRNATAVPRGSGTGFVWDRRGHIVTNYHVLQGSSGARVALADGSSWNAQLVGYYDNKDLAVLRIDAPEEKLRPVEIGSSHDLEVGQSVFAIGNPFGLDHTLSTGVVSAVGREIRAVSGEPIQGAIQTDAAINPGNSGGPLLDSRGRVIGVNTQIFSPSGTSSGVGFAVPIDTVNRVVPQLIRHGRVIRPVLGVELDEGRLSAQAGLGGVMVLGVQKDTGAERAGIVPARVDARTGTLILGDVITAIDDAPIRNADDVYRALDLREPGDNVVVKVIRERKELELQVEVMGVVDR